jgi:hypothetical protein
VGPDEIRALFVKLDCSSRQLADTLGVPHREVMDWEVEKRFPTKRHVARMKELAEEGPNAIAPKRSATLRARREAASPIEALADPAVWAIVRKLLAHPAFRLRVAELARDYDDPASGPHDGDTDGQS